MKRTVITLIKFGLSFAILAFLFNKAWQDDQFQTMWASDKNWGWLSVALLACFGAHFLSFFRWQLLVRALDMPFTLFDALRIGFIGSFFNLFAFGVIGGDSLRAFYASRQMKNRIPEAIASVIIDRVIGLLTMFSFAAGAYLLFDFSQLSASNPERLARIKLVCQIALVCSAIGFMGFVTLLFSPAVTNSNWFARLMDIPKIGPIIRKLTDMVNIYRSRPGTIAIGFLLSIGVNVCFVLTIYAIAAGVTQNYPSFSEHFVVEPISMVANAVPLPGGMGGMELALPFLYQGFSETAVTGSHGLVVAFGFRFALLLISAIGAFAWFMNRKQLKTLMDEGNLDVDEEDKFAESNVDVSDKGSNPYR